MGRKKLEAAGTPDHRSRIRVDVCRHVLPPRFGGYAIGTGSGTQRSAPLHVGLQPFASSEAGNCTSPFGTIGLHPANDLTADPNPAQQAVFGPIWPNGPTYLQPRLGPDGGSARSRDARPNQIWPNGPAYAQPRLGPDGGTPRPRDAPTAGPSLGIRTPHLFLR